MPKRTVWVNPLRAIKYKLVVVSLPKSTIRTQSADDTRFIHAMRVMLLNEPTMPGGSAPYCSELDASASCPPESVPPLGRAPFHTGPPTESANVLPPFSLKL